MATSSCQRSSRSCSCGKRPASAPRQKLSKALWATSSSSAAARGLPCSLWRQPNQSPEVTLPELLGGAGIAGLEPADPERYRARGRHCACAPKGCCGRCLLAPSGLVPAGGDHPAPAKKSRRGGTPAGIRPRRPTRQPAPRPRRVALCLVFRPFACWFPFYEGEPAKQATCGPAREFCRAGKCRTQRAGQHLGRQRFLRGRDRERFFFRRVSAFRVV